jgi:hypothetical protein
VQFVAAVRLLNHLIGGARLYQWLLSRTMSAFGGRRHSGTEQRLGF